jgi:hypothetical protein
MAEEPLSDKSTVLTVNVPEHLEPQEIKRELAKRGYHVVRSQIPHNTITNERTGQGVMQVRAPNDRHHEEARKEVENIGLRIKPDTRRLDARWK